MRSAFSFTSLNYLVRDMDMCVMQKKGKVTLFWRQKLAAHKQSKASLNGK